MPTKKARLQVVVSDDAAERVKTLAEERGLSISAMCGQLIHAALRLSEFKEKPDLSQLKAEMIRCAIQGGDIADPKIAELLAEVTNLEDT